jgi:hypothetical protein
VSGFSLSAATAKGRDVNRFPLLSQEVEIATVYGEDDIRPISITPPNYNRIEAFTVNDQDVVSVVY